MYQNLKKLWCATALSLVGTSMIHAAPESAQLRNLENRVSALEQRKGANGMINPSARPHVKGGADLFVYGDFLWWQAYENGLPLATKNKTTATTLNSAEVTSIKSNWDPGFRVGVGYNLGHDGWDLSLSWLRFYSNGHNKTSASVGQQVWPFWVNPNSPGSGASCVTASGSWRLHLNQLDLDMGREFFVSKWLTMRPHFGLRTAWARQKLAAKYATLTTPVGDTLEFSAKNRFWGLGVEGGLDTRWGLGSGFSLYGDLDAAILYGYNKATESEEYEIAATDFFNVRNSYRVSRPILDLALGLRWDHCWGQERFHIGLHAGWEHHIYFSQQQFMVFADDVAKGVFVSNQGDLSLQGWTFGARFDF